MSTGSGAAPGRDRISGGPGDDRINADDGERDKVRCGGGDDRLRADMLDRAKGCETTSVQAQAVNG